MHPSPAAPAVPRHIGIIMDGNGRWAQAQGRPRVDGHAEGVHSVRAITRACRGRGVEALTLYCFSSENWARPEPEVTALMGLLLHFLAAEREELLGNDIRLIGIGDRERLPPDVLGALQTMEAESAHGQEMVLNLAVSYGSRGELARAARQLATDARAGHIDPAKIDEAALGAQLDTAALPELDLLIRTGGDHRLSNFLLWQAAYAELYFTDVLWPDFREAQLDDALDEFARRHRRFGLTGEQAEGLL